MNVSQPNNQEWLQTNAAGGFCSGCVDGPPTRRYHGLLCASLNPPTDRHLLVSHLIETVRINDKNLTLSTEHYVDHRPDKTNLNFSFQAFPYAKWHYNLPEGSLEKSVIMAEGKNTTFVRYKNTGSLPLTLFLKPLVALRNYHALRKNSVPVEVEISGNCVFVQAWGEPKVIFLSSVADWKKTGDWYHQLYYAEESERGFDFEETNFSAAELTATLIPQETLILKFSTEVGVVNEKAFIKADKAYKNTNLADGFQNDIAWAAQQFLVHRASSHSFSVLAGYPWFTDWGRDTLIALRDFKDFMSLTQAQQILKTFLQSEKNGLIPNRFPDDPLDTIEYNTIDATLWLFVVLWELEKNDFESHFLLEVFPILTRILKAHIAGTDFNIKVLDSGLLSAGETGLALTWMDARVDAFVVTPREGCAVEINALWYNALKIYQAFQKQIKDTTLNVTPYVKAIEKNFTKEFWNPQTKTLYDVIDSNNVPDLSIRPNQLYALSLPFLILPKSKQKLVLQQVSKKLFTPFGIRTLSPEDSVFEPFYQGDAWSRDKAYHQGTAWPFLLREYFVAHEKIYGLRKTKVLLNPTLEALKNHFYHDAGVGSVSEVFDGLNPHKGKGCPQQAWSVAALWKMAKMSKL